MSCICQLLPWARTFELIRACNDIQIFGGPDDRNPDLKNKTFIIFFCREEAKEMKKPSWKKFDYDDIHALATVLREYTPLRLFLEAKGGTLKIFSPLRGRWQTFAREKNRKCQVSTTYLTLLFLLMWYSMYCIIICWHTVKTTSICYFREPYQRKI